MTIYVASASVTISGVELDHFKKTLLCHPGIQDYELTTPDIGDINKQRRPSFPVSLDFKNPDYGAVSILEAHDQMQRITDFSHAYRSPFLRSDPFITPVKYNFNPEDSLSAFSWGVIPRMSAGITTVTDNGKNAYLEITVEGIPNLERINSNPNFELQGQRYTVAEPNFQGTGKPRIIEGTIKLSMPFYETIGVENVGRGVIESSLEHFSDFWVVDPEASTSILGEETSTSVRMDGDTAYFHRQPKIVSAHLVVPLTNRRGHTMYASGIFIPSVTESLDGNP